ncbi:MAG: sporulation integral membrane protein YtvI [Thermaerobacterales bacterium]
MRDLIKIYGPIVVALAAVYLGMRYVLVLFLPFVLAVAMAVLVEPWVGLIERRLRLPRSVAAGAVLTLLTVIVVLLVVVGVTKLVVELGQFQDDIPQLYQTTQTTANTLIDRFGQWRAGLPEAVRDALDEQQEQWIGQARVSVEAGTDYLVRLLRRWALNDIPNAFIVLLVAVIATFFISKDRAVIRGALLAMVPAAWRDQFEELTRSLLRSLVGYVNAVLVLVFATALVTTLGLSILGTPYALLVGVVSGVLDLIPIIGPSLIFIPWITYHVIFGDVVFGIQLALLYGVITSSRLVLQAQVIGDRIGIHPLTTLLSLYVGVRLLGPIGLIVGPLSVVLLKSMVDTSIIPLDRSR